MREVQSSTLRTAFAVISGLSARGGFEEWAHSNRGQIGLLSDGED